VIPAAILAVVVQVRGVTQANKAIGTVDVGLSKAERSAVDATREVDKFGRTSATAKVDIDDGGARRTLDGLRQQIASLSDKTVHVHVSSSGGVDDGGAAASLGRTAQQANVLQRTISLVKPAALIAGLGFIAQAASVAAAGVVGLVAALAPLGGAIAAYPALLAAFAQGMGVAKLGLTGMDKATEQFGKALEKPTPAMNNFKKSLSEFVPQVVHLRNLAQGPILRGLSAGIDEAKGNFSRLNPIVRQTGNVLGGLAKDAGKLVGSSAFGRDLTTVGNRNTKIIDILGHAALNVADALRHVVVAAGPLTMWLARMAAMWAKAADQAAKNGRETGKMADFFDHTREVISRLLSIAGNLGTAFWNIAKGGKQLGDELLKSLDKTTESFAKWTKSAEGQNKIKAFFDRAKPAIYEVAKLIRDVTKGFVELGQQPGLATLIHQFRTQLLPILLRVLNSTTQAFGPHLIAMITAFARAFEPLAGSSGPLVMYVDILTGLAKAAAWITDNVPGAAHAITFLVGTLAVMKAANFGASILGIKKAMALLKSETVASAAVTVAWKVSMIAGAAASGIATAATWLFNAALAANPILLVVGLIAALVAAFLLLGGKVSWIGDAFGWLWNDVIVAGATAVLNWLKANWTTVLAILAAPIVLAVSAITTGWNAIKTVTMAVWNAIKAFLGATWDAIRGGVTSAVGGVRTAVTAAWDAISGATSAVWGAIKSVVTGAASAIGTAVKDSLGSLRDWISDTWSTIRDRAESAWGSIEHAITGAVRSALSTAKGLIGDFVGIGEDIVRGIARGITSTASSIANAVSDAVTGAIKKAKGVLGIGSPSKVFAGIGENTALGYAQGVARQAAAAKRAIVSLVTPPAAATSVVTGGGPPPTAGAGGMMDLSGLQLAVYIGGERIDELVDVKLERADRQAAQAFRAGIA
jgi:phage-related protein